MPIRTTTDSEFARGRLYVLFEVIFLLWKVSLTLVVHDTQLGLARFERGACPAGGPSEAAPLPHSSLRFWRHGAVAACLKSPFKMA